MSPFEPPRPGEVSEGGGEGVGRGARLTLFLAACVLLLPAACASGNEGDDGPNRPTETGKADEATGADRPCVPTAIRRTSPPEWTAVAGLPMPMPYALSPGDEVAAFFFTHPLLAGRARRGEPQNKVLWVVRSPKDGMPLEIVARSPDRNARGIAVPADTGGGSGEIQRSIIDLLRPGCWRLFLRWGAREATIDVRVDPRKR
jgi:hypothetical protein